MEEDDGLKGVKNSCLYHSVHLSAPVSTIASGGKMLLREFARKWLLTAKVNAKTEFKQCEPLTFLKTHVGLIRAHLIPHPCLLSVWPSV